jgi:hypothetical protein
MRFKAAKKRMIELTETPLERPKKTDTAKKSESFMVDR